MKKIIYISLAAIIIGIVSIQLLDIKTFEYNGVRYRPNESFLDKDGCNTCSFDKNGQMVCTLMACVPSDNSDMKTNTVFEYAGNVYKYKAMITKPTPCHKVSTEVIVREIYPEQVELRFTIQDSGDVCIQVIDIEEVSGEIAVSKNATINTYVNGILDDSFIGSKNE